MAWATRSTYRRLRPTAFLCQAARCACIRWSIYRDDSQALYGFATASERDFFRLMVENVTGVGPKVALGIMSRLSLPLLTGAIGSGDIATLAQCPGIGRKTAERLVVELKSKVGIQAVLPPSGGDAGAQGAGDGANSHRDAVAALVALDTNPPMPTSRCGAPSSLWDRTPQRSPWSGRPCPAVESLFGPHLSSCSLKAVISTGVC